MPETFLFLDVSLIPNIGRGLSESTRNRRFWSYFGVSIDGSSDVWCYFFPYFDKGKLPVHLLWILMFLKLYPTEEVGAGIARSNEIT